MITKRFAADTTVPAAKSKQQLDALLLKHGATQRGIFEESTRGVVMFTMQGRQFRISVKLPKVDNAIGPRARSKAEQDTRAAWRRVLLITKAKLEIALDSGSVESEFLADVLLPDGRTVHEALAPQLAKSYTDGQMPPLLPGASK
jgi:hypothetical protein